MIGSLGPLTHSFLPVALARFREQRPQVEAVAWKKLVKSLVSEHLLTYIWA
jgi:hypothetical protein